MSDTLLRSKVIRLAASMPKGSAVRTALLATLKEAARGSFEVSVDYDNITDAWSVYVHHGRHMTDVTGYIWPSAARAKQESKVILSQVNGGMPINEIGSYYQKKYHSLEPEI